MQFELAYFYALGATALFSSGTVVFTYFSRKISVLWMNFVKAIVAFLASAVVISLVYSWYVPKAHVIYLMLFSGFLGLNVADIFFLTSFKRIGPSRALMTFGLQPVLLGILGVFFLEQPFTGRHFLGTGLMVACVFVISLEKYKKEGKWESFGIFSALIAVVIDSAGNVMARHAFDLDPGLPALEGGFYRSGGAILGFIIISQFRPILLWEGFKSLSKKESGLALAGGFWGTFLSLWCWFSAIRIGHLASVSAVAMTGPLFGGIIEHIVERKMPHKLFYLALAFFISGFLIFNLGG